jgi:hypothetical protein
MQKPPLDPDVADVAPTASVLTGYDGQHLATYLRLCSMRRDAAADEGRLESIKESDDGHPWLTIRDRPQGSYRSPLVQ